MSDAPEPTQQSAASAQKALPPIPAPAPGTSRGSSKHSSNGSDNRSVHTDLPHPPSSGSIQAGVQAPMPMPALTSGDPQVGGQAGLPADAPQPTRQSVSSSKNSLPATPISQPTASGSEQASGVQASIPIPAPEPGHPGAIGQPPASGSGQAGVQAPISIPAPEPGHPLEGEGDVPKLSTPQVGGGGGVSASQPGNLRGQDNVPPENSQQGGAQGGAAGDAQANVQARLTGQRAFTSGRICLKNGWKACYLLSAMIFGGAMVVAVAPMFADRYVRTFNALALVCAIFAPALATLYLIRITRPEDVNDLVDRLGELMALISLLLPLGLELVSILFFMVASFISFWRSQNQGASIGLAVGAGILLVISGYASFRVYRTLS